jgi:hypothetical protein
MESHARVNVATAETSTLAALSRNLRAGMRLSLLCRTQREDFAASPEAFAVLVALNLAVLFALSFASVGVAGEFNSEALPQALMFVPLTLAFALLVERVSGIPGTLPVLATALVTAGTVLTVAVGLAGLLLDYQSVFLPAQAHWDVLFHGGIAWWFVVMVAAVVRLAPSDRPRNVLHTLAGVALLVAPAWWYPQSPLWMPAREGASAAGARAGSYALGEEQAFYAQHEVLTQALDALLPERPGVADLYVVAAGLDASEDVFMKDVLAVVDLFRRDFDADGRALALVNNPKTLEEYPIATLTSLTAALQRVGALMKVEEDILLLYVSSHGSDRHQLAVEFRPLRLAAIDPPALKRALDESGIRWKIVVVSACYSGGFVDPLKDAHAMVITASSASRPSFGCGHESDATYLAKAYFDEALRNTRSFEAAFQSAREAIGRRERARGFPPSEPQMFVGEAMREKLKEFERRVRAPAR